MKNADNPFSCNGKGKEEAEALNALLAGEALEYVDVCSITSYETFFAGVGTEDKLVLCGGCAGREGNYGEIRSARAFASRRRNDFKRKRIYGKGINVSSIKAGQPCFFC